MNPSAKNKDSIKHTLFMAITVSLVCSILVTTTAIYLKPKQQENLLRYSGIANISKLLATLYPAEASETLLSQLEVKIIDLETGEYTNKIDPSSFNQEEAAKDPTLSILIPEDLDSADIGQRSKYAMIYLLKDGSTIKNILLPVYGKGMWSTIYGYLALEADANTVAGILFYRHGETPGIGDKIENPDWLKQWAGKQVYENGFPVISITKKKKPGKAAFEIDAISGATMTTRGVNYLLEYWLGEHGYQPFLDKLATQE